MNKDMTELLPKPKKMKTGKGSYSWPRGKIACRVPAGSNLGAFFDENSKRFKVASGSGRPHVDVRIDRDALAGRSEDPDLLDEGYVLKVSKQVVTIRARTDAGLFYGLNTLAQLVRSGNRVPQMRIEDWPDMRFRGVHLMLGCLAPTFERMKRIVDAMTRHKINAFVIEYDHYFKWEKYPFICPPGGYSKEQTIELESFAADRFMQIVPCVDSLGHVGPYLQHKQLAHLREHPDEPHTLCPSNPKAREFIRDLWTEVLEGHPKAKYAHITGDEAFTRKGIACPKCKRKVARHGMGGLITDYYTELSEWIREHGRIPMMWDDMISKQPEATDRIPNDIVMCDWEYENLDVDSWSAENIYWNNEGAKSGAWEKLFGPYWKPDKKGRIKPFPYMRYFHEKGNPVLASPAACLGGPVIPYVGTAGRHANIMRFADEAVKNGVLGLLDTFWPIGVPFDAAWNNVMMGADYGWHARLEKTKEFNERFAHAVFGAGKAEGKIFEKLDNAVYRAKPGELVVYKKAFLEKDRAGLIRQCRSVSRKLRNTDYAVFADVTTWCAEYSNATAGLGRIFNRVNALRLGAGTDRPVDLSKHVTHDFQNGTISGTKSLPFQAGRLNVSGVRFDVIDPEKNKGRSVLTLKSPKMPNAPLKVTGIKVGRKADRVFMLCSGYNAYDDVAIAEVVFTMEDGGKHRFEIVGGMNILDWQGGKNRSMPEGVFATERMLRKSCMCWWNNPEPGKKIVSMEFRSPGDKGSLTVAGVTTRVLSGKQPVVDARADRRSIDKIEKEIESLLKKLSRDIYPRVMAEGEARGSYAARCRGAWSEWMAIYRDILKGWTGRKLSAKTSRSYGKAGGKHVSVL